MEHLANRCHDLCDTDVTPVYQSFKGWQTDLTDIRSFVDVPAELANLCLLPGRHAGITHQLHFDQPDREAIIHRQAVIA